MSFLPSLPGPHDVPFAGPLMAAAILGFIIGFVILKLIVISSHDEHKDVDDDNEKPK